MIALLPAGFTLVDNDVYIAVVEGFATLGLIMAFYSGVLAFQALISNNTPEQIGHAANYGLAVGFAVGAILSSLVFISAMTNIE